MLQKNDRYPALVEVASSMSKALSSSIWFEMSIKAYNSVTS